MAVALFFLHSAVVKRFWRPSVGAVGGEFRVIESSRKVMRASQAIRSDDGVVAEQPPWAAGIGNCREHITGKLPREHLTRSGSP